LTAGCSTLLPSAKQTIQSPWNSFEDAKAYFDKITPRQSTTKELKELGFDPFSTPNIKILTYLDIMNRFMPNPSVKKEELDEGIQACIDAKADCKAYEFEPKIIRSKRFGNFWLDLFNFKRQTKESGWKFEALIVLIDDIVVYKLWGGSPIIDETKETKNPLGPFQNADDLLKERTRINFK
jgi:hypothetical protein